MIMLIYIGGTRTPIAIIYNKHFDFFLCVECG